MSDTSLSYFSYSVYFVNLQQISWTILLSMFHNNYLLNSYKVWIDSLFDLFQAKCDVSTKGVKISLLCATVSYSFILVLCVSQFQSKLKLLKLVSSTFVSESKDTCNVNSKNCNNGNITCLNGYGKQYFYTQRTKLLYWIWELYSVL